MLVFIKRTADIDVLPLVVTEKLAFKYLALQTV